VHNHQGLAPEAASLEVRHRAFMEVGWQSCDTSQKHRIPSKKFRYRVDEYEENKILTDRLNSWQKLIFNDCESRLRQSKIGRWMAIQDLKCPQASPNQVARQPSDRRSGHPAILGDSLWMYLHRGPDLPL